MTAFAGWGAKAPLGVLTLAAMTLGGCSTLRDHKGYIVDSTLINTVAPGIDNKDSVYKTLGRPSLVGQFDQDRTWYYVARDTRQMAFSTPNAVSQMLLTVRFTPGGDVASVQKTGLETVRDVRLYGKTTPTLGRNTNFFSELFGGIGTVGATGGGAPTADNPN